MHETEQRVLERLNDALDAKEYTLHHSIDWMALAHERPGKAQSEIDICIRHPQGGVLVIVDRYEEASIAAALQIVTSDVLVQSLASERACGVREPHHGVR